jgi:hypothetical protein
MKRYYMKLNKKIAILLLAAMMVNPALGSVADKIKDCFSSSFMWPLLIPCGKKGQIGEVIAGKLVNAQVGENCGNCILLSSGLVSSLAVYGGIAAGVVAAVKYYKKKKQIAHEGKSVELNQHEDSAMDVQNVEEETVIQVVE